MKPALFALIVMLCQSCSSRTEGEYPPASGMVSISGVIEVLAAGTRSETLILSDESTGEVVALVGENAELLRGSMGVPATVTGSYTTEGWSIRPDLRKFLVAGFTMGGETSSPDRYED